MLLQDHKSRSLEFCQLGSAGLFHQKINSQFRLSFLPWDEESVGTPSANTELW